MNVVICALLLLKLSLGSQVTTPPAVPVMDDPLDYPIRDGDNFRPDHRFDTCLESNHPQMRFKYSGIVKTLDSFLATTVSVSEVLVPPPSFKRLALPHPFPEFVPALRVEGDEWSFAWLRPRNLGELRMMLTVADSSGSAVGTVYPAQNSVVVRRGTEITAATLIDAVLKMVRAGSADASTARCFLWAVAQLPNWDLERFLLHPHEVGAKTTTELARILHGGYLVQTVDGLLDDEALTEAGLADLLRGSVSGPGASAGIPHWRDFGEWFDYMMDSTLRLLQLNQGGATTDMTFWQSMRTVMRQHWDSGASCPPGQGPIGGTGQRYTEEVLGSLLGERATTAPSKNFTKITSTQRTTLNFEAHLANESQLYAQFKSLGESVGISVSLHHMLVMRLEILFMLGFTDLVPVIPFRDARVKSLLAAQMREIFATWYATRTIEHKVSVSFFYRAIMLSGTLFGVSSHQGDDFGGKEVFAAWQEAKVLMGEIAATVADDTASEFYQNQAEQGTIGVAPRGSFPGFSGADAHFLSGLDPSALRAELQRIEQTMPVSDIEPLTQRSDVCPAGLVLVPDETLMQSLVDNATYAPFALTMTPATVTLGRCVCPGSPKPRSVLAYSIRGRSCLDVPDPALINDVDSEPHIRPYATSGILAALFARNISLGATNLSVRPVPLSPIGYALTSGGLGPFDAGDSVWVSELIKHVTVPDEILADLQSDHPHLVVFDQQSESFVLSGVTGSAYARLREVPADRLEVPSNRWEPVVDFTPRVAPGTTYGVLKVDTSELSCPQVRVGLLSEETVVRAALLSPVDAEVAAAIAGPGRFDKHAATARLVLAAAQRDKETRSMLLGQSGFSRVFPKGETDVPLDQIRAAKGFLFAICADADVSLPSASLLESGSFAAGSFIVDMGPSTVPSGAALSVLPEHSAGPSFTAGEVVVSSDGAIGLPAGLVGEYGAHFHPLILSCGSSESPLLEAVRAIRNDGWELCFTELGCPVVPEAQFSPYQTPLRSSVAEESLSSVSCSLVTPTLASIPLADVAVPPPVPVADEVIITVPAAGSASHLIDDDTDSSTLRVLSSLFALRDVGTAESSALLRTATPSLRARVFYKAFATESRLLARVAAEEALVDLSSSNSSLIEKGWSHSSFVPQVNLTEGASRFAALVLLDQRDGVAVHQTVIFRVPPVPADTTPQRPPVGAFEQEKVDVGTLPLVFVPGRLVWPLFDESYPDCGTPGAERSTGLFSATRSRPFVVPADVSNIVFASAAQKSARYFCVSDGGESTSLTLGSFFPSQEIAATILSGEPIVISNPDESVLKPVFWLFAVVVIIFDALLLLFVNRISLFRQCEFCHRRHVFTYESRLAVPQMKQPAQGYLCGKCVHLLSVLPTLGRDPADCTEYLSIGFQSSERAQEESWRRANQ